MFLLLLFLVDVQGYKVPPVEIDVYEKGFSASIPDARGMGLFSFNGNVNSDLSSPDVGQASGEVLQARDGRWVYTNNDIRLKKGDVINYWVMVSVDSLGYLKDNLSFKYNGELSEKTTTPCIPSITVVQGQRPCSREVVFHDRFDTFENWQVEQYIPLRSPDYPFVSYQNIESIIGVRDGALHIKPIPLQTMSHYSRDSILSGSLDLLQGCTDSDDMCTMTASGFDILPPIVSGRADTKDTFTFKYGIIEIRAKLPRGDWLYPDLLLQPLANKYGQERFASGQVVVATALGNIQLKSGGRDISNHRLVGGLVVDQFQCHDRLLYNKTSELWSDKFHDYKLMWTPDGFTWYVDGESYGSLPAPAQHLSEKLKGCTSLVNVFQRWARGDRLAPFDQEFYLTLGVSVGGITMFPDKSITDEKHNKPWNNLSSKAKLFFWEDMLSWYSTWGDRSQLVVDSVKVTAL